MVGLYILRFAHINPLICLTFHFLPLLCIALLDLHVKSIFKDTKEYTRVLNPFHAISAPRALAEPITETLMY